VAKLNRLPSKPAHKSNVLKPDMASSSSEISATEICCGHARPGSNCSYVISITIEAALDEPPMNGMVLPIKALSARAQEKNAIFSLWLMRRIGASGSLAGMLGLRKIPLAMMVEPSESSDGASRGGSRSGCATG
jgi:hypothetical protein